MHRSRTELRVDLDGGIRVGGEQEQRPEQVVEPAACAPHDDDPLRLQPQGCRERELEIARVLLRRVPLDARDVSQRLRRDRVQIADEQVHRPSQLGSAVGRYHRRARGQNYGRGIGPAGKNDHGSRHRSILARRVYLRVFFGGSSSATRIDSSEPMSMSRWIGRPSGMSVRTL